MSLFIKEINIIAFGKFENLTIDLNNNFNLIYGHNESGKSTLRAFIEGILYGFDEGNKVRRFNEKQNIYKPLHSYKYAGFIIFNKDGIDYRVSRDFFDGRYEVYDLTNNIEIDSQKSNLNFPGEFLLGLEYTVYQNLISNYQSQDSSEKARSKITEILNQDGDYLFSATDAIRYLEDLEKEIGTDRAYTKPYAITKSEIDNLNQKLLDLKDLRKHYYTDFKNLDKNKKEIENISKKLRELKDKRKTYRKNIAYQNFEDEKYYLNEIDKVNNKLKKFKGYERDQMEPNPGNIDYTYLIIALILSLLLIVIYNLFKVSYLILIAVLIPIWIGIYLKYKESFRLDNINKYNDGNIKDYEYQSLVNEKENLEKILDILSKQEKSIGYSSHNIDFDIDITSIEDRIENYENKLSNLNEINLKLNKNIASAEEKLKDELYLYEKLESKESDLEKMEDELKAIRFAKDKIMELSKKDNSSNIDNTISEIIRTISNNRYLKIAYDDDNLPLILTNKGEAFSIDMLSTGFYDQVNFAYKFSVLNKFTNNFIIFDDAFINYDIERLRRSLFLLLDIADSRQIIYFTSHTREYEVLTSENIRFNLINLEEV